jgi:5-methylcytosine-specific restriction endonuclease McrA
MTSGHNMQKFCKRCNCESTRYADGRCITCTLARNAEWTKQNPDKKNEISRRWNELNRHQKREINAAYRTAKNEVIKQKRKLQRQQDPSMERVKAATRKALKLGNGGQLSKNIVQVLLTKQGGLCACCKQPLNGSFHLDHIMPLSLGGQNDDGNVQLLLPRCNLEKFTSTPEKFMARRLAEKLRTTKACDTVS